MSVGFQAVTFPQDRAVACTGCGALVLDQDQHRKFHRNLGDPEDLSHLGGANDVPPLPERER